MAAFLNRPIERRLAFAFGSPSPIKGAGVSGPFDIVLLAGQSNMAGRGAYDPALDTTDPRILQFDGHAASATYRTIIPAIDRLKHPELTQKDPGSVYIGPGMTFAKAYLAQTGRNVLLVPVAWGGTSLVATTGISVTPGPNWASGSPGGQLYEGAITQANLAIAAATARDAGSQFVGTLWLQGESDGDAAVTTAAYKSAFASMIAGLRSRITGASASWFITASMMPEAISGQAGYPAIDAAHLQVMLEGSNVAFVRGPRGYQKDAFHYLAAGQRIIGAALEVARARVSKAEIIHDFECDVVGGSAALGLTNDSTATISIVSDGGSKRLTAAGLTAGDPAQGLGVLFDAVAPGVTDQVVEWSEYSTTDTYRTSMTLRAGETKYSGGAGNIGRTGYLFQKYSQTGLRILRVDAAAFAVIGNYAVTSALSRRYRASSIGTSHKFEYSDDNGATWTTAGTAIDATYSAGRMQYLQGFGQASSGIVKVDDIRIRRAI